MPGATGGSESFKTAEVLIRVARKGLLLDVSVVPTVRLTDRHGQDIPLNRYILDYWSHRQKQPLIKGNGLREGTAHLFLFAHLDRILVHDKTAVNISWADSCLLHFSVHAAVFSTQ